MRHEDATKRLGGWGRHRPYLPRSLIAARWQLRPVQPRRLPSGFRVAGRLKGSISAAPKATTSKNPLLLRY